MGSRRSVLNVEARRTIAVYLVSFGEQQFRQERSVLAGDAGNESAFHLSLVEIRLDLLHHVFDLRCRQIGVQRQREHGARQFLAHRKIAGL